MNGTLTEVEGKDDEEEEEGARGSLEGNDDDDDGAEGPNSFRCARA
jgi:hypothetical protein